MLARLRATYPKLFSLASLLVWLSALWKPIDLILSWIGVVDTARSIMDPNHWFTHLVFWPHLGLIISTAGVGGLFVLLLLDRGRVPLAQPKLEIDRITSKNFERTSDKPASPEPMP